MVILPGRISTAGIADCPLGAVPVPADSPEGEVRVLLRPEQIVATPANGSANAVVPK